VVGMTTMFSKANMTPLLLRMGLATVFLFASISSFFSPNEWAGYFPQFMRDLVPLDLLLRGFSAYEFALALWLLSGYYTKYAALLCATTLGGIVVANPNLAQITFRDVALVFAAIALFFATKDKG
jgi:uncharacterized membrane protein YphA (DoxX/SURF4 family)